MKLKDQIIDELTNLRFELSFHENNDENGVLADEIAARIEKLNNLLSSLPESKLESLILLEEVLHKRRRVLRE